MQYEFTPAAQRAIEAAARWCAPGCALEGPELMLGLLAEEECRAALMLARHGIDGERVRGRWRNLRLYEDADAAVTTNFSAALQNCLGAAEERLYEYSQPLTLATEHLLLGLAAAPGDVSTFLAECGIDADQIEAEIHRLNGQVPEMLGVERDEPSVCLVGDSAPDAQMSPSELSGIMRVVDAAANRAAEGLRVIEDYARFSLDDRFLTQQCKQLRHRLSKLISYLPAHERLSARESQTDIGLVISAPGETVRKSATDVVAASFQRTQQALRSLEEYTKLLDTTLSRQLELFRYEAYTLERAADSVAHSVSRLATARLYVLVDGRENPLALQTLLERIIEGGADVVQLRDKNLPDRELLDRARIVREITAAAGKLFIMNDRPDLALAARADGVHLGQDDLSVKDARTLVGPNLLLGVSTHSLDQARQAVLDGANYIGVGPVYSSATKSFSQVQGLDLVRTVAAELRLPAYAIGGISPDNMSEVAAAGASRIAVSSAVLGASDPASVLGRLRSALVG